MICQRRLKPNFRGPGPDGQRRRSILPRGLCAAAGPLLMFKAGPGNPFSGKPLGIHLSGYRRYVAASQCANSRLVVKRPAATKSNKSPRRPSGQAATERCMRSRSN